MPAKTNPRDLSRRVSGRINIRIFGLSTSIQIDLGREDTLASYVTQALISMSQSAPTVTDPANSPWELISFDDRKNVLVVQPAKE